MLPNDTRGKIITLLKRKHGMSASEIADTLNFHSMTVRQHLSILEREGYVEHRQEKIRRGRGRHTFIISLVTLIAFSRATIRVSQ